MPKPTRILYCDCRYVDVVPADVRDGVLGRLCASGVAFTAVSDLCELAARRDPLLAELAASGPLAIVACYPRAVRWLFDAAGAPLPGEGVELLNMREQDACAIFAALLGDQADGLEPDPAQADALRRDLDARRGPWVPWFPVIDRDRCTGCRQCLDFCLFGAYALADDGRVEVRHPANCKTWCPACARVCPEVAIIFPKYKASPVHGGEVTEADARREKVRVDPAALAAGDVYARLRARTRRGRFSAEKSPEQSLAERRQRLAELREALDIPPEVLESLRAEGLRGGGEPGPSDDDHHEGTPRGCCD